VTFPAMYGAGLSARYVAGWDYYNIGFGNRLGNPGGWRPALGIVLDHSIAMHLR